MTSDDDDIIIINAYRLYWFRVNTYVEVFLLSLYRVFYLATEMGTSFSQN